MKQIVVSVVYIGVDASEKPNGEKTMWTKIKDAFWGFAKVALDTVEFACFFWLLTREE